MRKMHAISSRIIPKIPQFGRLNSGMSSACGVFTEPVQNTYQVGATVIRPEEDRQRALSASRNRLVIKRPSPGRPPAVRPELNIPVGETSDGNANPALYANCVKHPPVVYWKTAGAIGKQPVRPAWRTAYGRVEATADYLEEPTAFLAFAFAKDT